MACKNPLILLASYVFTLMVSASAAADSIWDFQPPVTPVAEETLHMHLLVMYIITIIFLGVLSLVIYSILKHRKKNGTQPANFTGPSTRAQIIWSVIPFIAFLYIDYVIIGVPAYSALVAMEDTRTNADMTVKVIGSQWKWQYEYPNEKIKFVSAMSTPPDQIHEGAAKGENYLLEVDNPLVLPVGKKVRILTTATDVIHAWWVPAFGVKRDSIPGYIRETWVKIEKPGTYRGQCAQLCGKDHGYMPIVVEAVSEDKFNQWVAVKQAETAVAEASSSKEWAMADLMKAGEEVYGKICVGCHQANGQGVPGAFPALAGSKLVNAPFLDAGGLLIKDRHLDRVMNGKPGTPMQAYKNSLSDAEIAAVVTFERNSFGNHMGDMVQPSQVKALR